VPSEPDAASNEPPASARAVAWVGWAAAAAALAWAVLIHHGVGPAPEGEPRRWFEPIGFLLESESLEFVFTSVPRAIGILGLPVLAALLVIWITTPFAVARAIGITATITTALFVFYGVFAPFAWRFFGWRGSAVLAVTAAWVGIATAAPLLAASWLRLGWARRLILYLPIACASIAFVRNATGTDPELRYAISPWPAVPVFGIEVAGSFFAAAWLGIAVALAGLAPRGDERIGARTLRSALAAGFGLAIAIGGVALAAFAGMLPFSVGTGTLVGVAVLCSIVTGLVATLGVRGDAIARRARIFAVAAVLIGAPLISGQLLARIDYERARSLYAEQIIQALERHYERESIYPEHLDQLVAAGDLDEIPEPAIGFRLLGGGDFTYHDFGTSYLLEFASPRWVECAYSPPYVDDDDEGSSEDAALEGAWSCPSEPPELW
jgi:hypothetical protein